MVFEPYLVLFFFILTSNLIDECEYSLKFRIVKTKPPLFFLMARYLKYIRFGTITFSKLHISGE
jgi:hypothetical protein